MTNSLSQQTATEEIFSLEEFADIVPENQKVEVSTEAMDQMVSLMQQKWDKYEEQENIAKELKKDYLAQEKLVLDTLVAIGKQKWQVEGLGTASILNRQSFTTPKTIEDKEALFGYITQKYGKETLWGYIGINSQTLNAFAKKELEIDPALSIPGLTSPTVSQSIGFRAEKKKVTNG